MFVVFSYKYMCYWCSESSEDSILIPKHSVKAHPLDSLSIRRNVINQSTGEFRYQSVHFHVNLSNRKERLMSDKVIISWQPPLITFKRVLENDDDSSNKYLGQATTTPCLNALIPILIQYNVHPTLIHTALTLPNLA